MPQLLPKPDPNDEEALIALLSQPLKPQSSQQVLDLLRNAKPVQPKMRAATPEERVVGKLEEEGDPQADMVRQQFQVRPKAPVGPTSMRAATTMERGNAAASALLNKLKPAWMQADEARNPQVPEPFHVTFDPMMGSAAPEKVVGALGKALTTGGKKVAGEVAETAASHVDDLASAKNALMREGFALDEPAAAVKLSQPPATVANLAREPRPFNKLMNELLKDPEAVAGGRRLEQSMKARGAPAPARAPAKVKAPPKAQPFEWAPVDEAATARQTMLKGDAPIRYRELPKDARPTALSKLLTTPPANPDDFVGVTVSPITGQKVIGGAPGPTMAGKFPNQNKRTISVPRGQFTQKHIQQFYDTNRDVLGKDPEAFLGGWYDKESDSIFLDVSKGFLNKEGTGDIRKATKFAEEQNPGTVMGKMAGKSTGIERDPATGKWPQAQKALFDPETYSEPKVGNLYEFLSGLTKDAGGRSFRDRIREMADIGKRAMKGEDPEWWDIRKTAKNPNAPIPRVYGEEGVKPMAGYTATMSPQNGPVDDMQMASEYMRRHIKGEPVVQPEWRVPETAMGKQPKSEGGGGFTPRAGAKFPNEKFYSVNAQKVREGRYDELTQDKVNDMYQALMGGDVAVLDRHWAKLAEDPASGIYTATEKNVIQPSMTSGKIEAYPTMYNAERDAALEAGVPIKQHSAWVWEGIRDTIRRTGELFGQKHAAGAVPETTTGFNEIFENLLQKKAAHLGITVEKMEQLLRSGDESLLAALLATPVGVEAYRRWKSGQGSPEESAPVARPPSRAGGGT